MIKKYKNLIISLCFCYALAVFIVLTVSYVTYSKQVIAKYNSGDVPNGNNNISLKYNEATIRFDEDNSSDLEDFNTCYTSKVTEEDFSVELYNKYKNIEEYFKNSDVMVSFTYEDLYTGLNISYNEDYNYFAASTIKSPVVTYIYDMYVNGKISFDEVLTYTSNYYVDGTGSMQYEEVGTEYSIGDLVEKTIVDSDNIAYQMLASRLYDSDINNYWKSLGAKSFWTYGSVWGQVNSHDGVIYMKQLYNLVEDNSDIKEELLGYHYNSVVKLITVDNSDVMIAHKSGWTDANIHDLAIVYDEHPYVLAITSLKGYSDYETFFKEASNLIYEFHNIYWNNKAIYCYDKFIK